MDENETVNVNNLYSNDYELEEKIIYADKDKGEVLDKDDIKKLKPYDVMVAAAKSLGIELNKPKKDCRKCYGRGYTGFSLNGQPVPCSCVFKKEDYNDVPLMNHAGKRRARLEIRRRLKKQKKLIAKNKLKNNGEDLNEGTNIVPMD